MKRESKPTEREWVDPEGDRWEARRDPCLNGWNLFTLGDLRATWLPSGLLVVYHDGAIRASALRWFLSVVDEGSKGDG